MTTARINDRQAREFALAIVSDVGDYIRAHEAEYIAYLERTGQYDEQYRPNDGNTEDSAT